MRDALGKFEERLWSIVRRFLVLARTDPARLVAAVRVVELQQMVDAQLAVVRRQQAADAEASETTRGSHPACETGHRWMAVLLTQPSGRQGQASPSAPHACMWLHHHDSSWAGAWLQCMQTSCIHLQGCHDQVHH